MTQLIYEALANSGLAYERPARIIGELPPNEVLDALEKATLDVARIIGFAAQRRIPYGAPAYVAFGMDRTQAKNHHYSSLLLSKGENLPLELSNMNK